MKERNKREVEEDVSGGYVFLRARLGVRKETGRRRANEGEGRARWAVEEGREG